MRKNDIPQTTTEQERYWFLRGLMVKHYGKHLRPEQIDSYSSDEMLALLKRDRHINA